MGLIVVANNPKDWEDSLENIDIVSAKTYLTDPSYAELKNARVINLCRSYKYQSIGYYVSLIAEARSHKAIPNVLTMQDLKSLAITRVVTEEIDETIQKSLSRIKSENFALSIYFGKNIAHQYDKLAKQLYNLFQAPLLRAFFAKNKNRWVLQNINAISLKDIPEHHKEFVKDFSKEYFSRKRFCVTRKANSIFDMAILINPEEEVPPSNKKAIQNFICMAEKKGFGVELVTKDDFNRLPEFDALFIRETTSVKDHTYRFSRRAEAEGLVVMDDPDSILRCSNKVYLTELLNKAKVPIPKTMIVHKDNRETVKDAIGLPCVLKLPDGAFSRGVKKAMNEEELKQKIDEFMLSSELIIAQEYIPTDFDWRIGILDKKPIFACKYFMAKDFWQIFNWGLKNGAHGREGGFETLPVSFVPEKVLKVAVKAANLIGDGLYGVDLKEVGNDVVVIEINDNPNVDAGLEDVVLKDQLYEIIINSILNRIKIKKHQGTHWL